jgi:uncharacterized protein YutE (UPF0331/DUF86 family)
VTFLAERLAELKKHLVHLRAIGPRVEGPHSLAGDLSLHNDVLFSLLTIAQLVIDISGEIGARRGMRFEDYTQAIRNLASVEGFPPDLVERLARLPGFRNVLLHDYVELDYSVAVAALKDLEPVERFLRIVASMEAKSGEA